MHRIVLAAVPVTLYLEMKTGSDFDSLSISATNTLLGALQQRFTPGSLLLDYTMEVPKRLVLETSAPAYEDGDYAFAVESDIQASDPCVFWDTEVETVIGFNIQEIRSKQWQFSLTLNKATGAIWDNYPKCCIDEVMPFATTDETPSPEVLAEYEVIKEKVHTLLKRKRRAPNMPMVLTTSITVINSDTLVSDARKWIREIETHYDEYFGSPDDPRWVWEDAHVADLKALCELTGVLSPGGSLGGGEVVSFADDNWRDAWADVK